MNKNLQHTLSAVSTHQYLSYYDQYYEQEDDSSDDGEYYCHDEGYDEEENDYKEPFRYNYKKPNSIYAGKIPVEVEDLAEQYQEFLSIPSLSREDRFDILLRYTFNVVIFFVSWFKYMTILEEIGLFDENEDTLIEYWQRFNVD